MEFTTTNEKKEVKINPASMKEAMALKKAVLKNLLNGVNIGSEEEINAVNLIDSIGRAMINIDTSEEFEKAVMECLQHCVYDGKYKITQQLFDDIPEARNDYYEILIKCCEVNLRPFFKSLVSELKTRFPQLELPTLQLNAVQSST